MTESNIGFTREGAKQLKREIRNFAEFWSELFPPSEETKNVKYVENLLRDPKQQALAELATEGAVELPRILAAYQHVKKKWEDSLTQTNKALDRQNELKHELVSLEELAAKQRIQINYGLKAVVAIMLWHILLVGYYDEIKSFALWIITSVAHLTG